MTSEISANDMFESLTGFDEIAISKAFDADIEALRGKPFMFLRALIFVDKRRQGLKDREARETALGLTMRDLGEYFPDDEPEMDPDDPVSDSGKGDEPNG